jgi:DNA transposition AAA+ family ATPase
MRDVFIETEAVGLFRSAVDTMVDANKGLSGFVLAWGQAGRGKTMAASNYYTERGGIYLRVWQDWTQAAFLQRLLHEARGANGDVPTHNCNRCKTMIVDILEKVMQPIFVDEADRLHVGRLEDLRDIHEATGVPVVLIGEEDLMGLLAKRRRIWSRVTHEVQFGPIRHEEIMLYALRAAGLSVPPDVCGMMATRAEGDFRLVRNMLLQLEQVAKVRETSEVDKDMLEDALRGRSWRRS